MPKPLQKVFDDKTIKEFVKYPSHLSGTHVIYLCDKQRVMIKGEGWNLNIENTLL